MCCRVYLIFIFERTFFISFSVDIFCYNFFVTCWLCKLFTLVHISFGSIYMHNTYQFFLFSPNSFQIYLVLAYVSLFCLLLFSFVLTLTFFTKLFSNISAVCLIALFYSFFQFYCINSFSVAILIYFRLFFTLISIVHFLAICKCVCLFVWSFHFENFSSCFQFDW